MTTSTSPRAGGPGRGRRRCAGRSPPTACRSSAARSRRTGRSSSGSTAGRSRRTPGSSTLMTSAPKSRSIRPAVGAAYIVPSSRTVTPASGGAARTAGMAPPRVVGSAITTLHCMCLTSRYSRHAPLAELAADPGAAVAAERRVGAHAPPPLIHTVPARICWAMRPGLDGVVAPDVGRQPVCGVVGQPDGLSRCP